MKKIIGKLLDWIEAALFAGQRTVGHPGQGHSYSFDNAHKAQFSDDQPESGKDLSLQKFNLISLAVVAILMVLFCFMVHFKWITGLKYLILIDFILAVVYFRLFFVVTKKK